jgi:hypothetical protein
MINTHWNNCQCRTAPSNNILAGVAIYSGTAPSSSSSFVLMLVAAFGILFVVLLNFIHRE